MKYIRFLSKNNIVYSGVLNPDNSIDIINGNIFGDNEKIGEVYRVEDIKEYMVPVDVPVIIALGGNYAEHVKECQEEVPCRPLVFLKAITSSTAHKSKIILPKPAPNEVDYEAELGVIIGKQAKNITPGQASEYILGYTCVNDISARDCQLKLDKQWARGKSFDTFCPAGPILETELDTSDVRIKLFLNGECMQNDSTKNLVYSVYEIVSYLSKNMTLLPGTLILTGTPSGVGLARKPQVFLKHGDKVVVDIEGIGSLENLIALE